MKRYQYRPPPPAIHTGYCRDCRTRIWVALWDALPLFMDTQALSLLGELHSHLRGLETWWQVGEHLYKRHAGAIQESPHGYGGVVYRTHSCMITQPLGDELALRVKDRYAELDF